MILTTHIKEQGAGRRQWLYHREYNCGDKAFSYANTLAEKRAKAECYENYTVDISEYDGRTERERGAFTNLEEEK